MRIVNVAVGLAVVMLLGCDRNAPLDPEFTTEVNPEYCYTQPDLGRMTGGGVVRLLADDGGRVKLTHGFTLHCDNRLSNNLEVNWEGYRWHIEKESLSRIACTDEPGVDPVPPPAPFDTFDAWAEGRLNGVWGSVIHFRLQDAGEPGGKGDKAMIVIWDVGADPETDDPILSVGFGYTETGNIQAHYDQPHGNKPN